MSSVSSIRPTLSGVAVVCCPHDREKRQITTEAQVADLAKEVGKVYDPAQHKLFNCSCCQNLFVDPGDEPLRCHACRQPNVHPLGGPLPEPTGRIA
jgi:hypothetical protein